MSQYTKGTLVTISAEFKVSAVDTDPTGITFKIELPDETQVTYVYGTDAQLVKDSTGKYHVDYLLSLSGSYTYRFAGVGACQAAMEGSILVPYSPFS